MTDATPHGSAHGHVCPWWLIRTFDNPVRRLIQNPEAMLRDVVRPGMRCLDVGCGYGYFTIPMARLVGAEGSVTAVDLQPEMLAGVKKRAQKAGLLDRVILHEADASGLRLEGTFDFALVFWMAHEVPDQGALFREVAAVLKPGGQLLLVEPRGHVTPDAFAASVDSAEEAGFVRIRDVDVPLSRALLVERADPEAAAADRQRGPVTGAEPSA